MTSLQFGIMNECPQIPFHEWISTRWSNQRLLSKTRANQICRLPRLAAAVDPFWTPTPPILADIELVPKYETTTAKPRPSVSLLKTNADTLRVWIIDGRLPLFCPTETWSLNAMDSKFFFAQKSLRVWQLRLGLAFSRDEFLQLSPFTLYL